MLKRIKEIQLCLVLKNRLQYADNEKEDLTVAHNQEIAKLNRKLQESSTVN